MREIKFRGKSNIFGWVYGCYAVVDGNAHIFEEDDLVEDGHHIRQESDRPTWVDENTIGQYTGLKDANGKEIYEGDIVKVEEYTNELMKIEHKYDDFEVFSLDEIKGEKTKEFISGVFCEDGSFFLKDSDISGYYLNAIAGDMKRSQPIFVTKVIGNIHDNPELL